MKRIQSLPFILTATLLLAACSPTSPVPTTPAPTLSVTPAALTLTTGQQQNATLVTTDTTAVTVEGTPSGLSATISGSSVTVTDTAAAQGTYPLTVTATGPGGAATATLTVTVTPPPPTVPSPDFTLTLSPSALTLPTGASGTTIAAAAPMNGFSSALTYTVAGVPAGLTATFSGPDLAVSNSNAPAGTYGLVVTAVGGGVTHAALLNVTVPGVTPPPGSPDFSFSASPSTLTLPAGVQNTVTLSTTAQNGFNAPLTYSVSGAPAGLTATLTGNVLSVQNINAAPGTYPLNLSATGGGVTHGTAILVTIPALQSAAPDFALSSAPASLTLASGASGATQLTVTPSNGFTGPVSFTVAGAPSGLGAAITGSTLNVTNTSAAAGTYTLVVTGTSGTLSHTTSVNVTVSGGTASTDASIGAASDTITLPENGSIETQFYLKGADGKPDLGRPYTGALDLVNQTELAAQGITLTQQNGLVTLRDSGTTQPDNYFLKVKPAGASVNRTATILVTFNVANSAKMLVADAVALDTTGVSQATYTIQGNNIGHVAPFVDQLPYEGKNNQASRVEVVTTPGLRNSVETLTLKFGFAGFDTPPVHFDLMVYYKDGTVGRLPVTLQYKTTPPKPFHRYPAAIHPRSPQEQAAINELNAIRASGTCDGKQYGTFPPIQTDAALDNANREYAANNATYNYTDVDRDAIRMYALLNGYLDDSFFFGSVQDYTTYDRYSNPAGDDGKAFADFIPCSSLMQDMTNFRVSVAFYPYKPSSTSSPTGGYWSYLGEQTR